MAAMPKRTKVQCARCGRTLKAIDLGNGVGPVLCTKCPDWGQITLHDDDLMLDGQILADRDQLELELANGSPLPATWYKDTFNRPAAFINLRLDNQKLFKVLIYIPKNVSARRVF